MPSYEYPPAPVEIGATSFKADSEYLKWIDASLRTIKRIALWWSVASIAAALLFLFYVLSRI